MPKRLAGKLILSLTFIVVIVEGAFEIWSLHTREGQVLESMVMGADQLSRSITSATWHAMLADRRHAAYEVMRAIAAEQGINRIRILNKEGRVMFSTKPDDDAIVDKSAEACFVCHSREQPLVHVEVPSRARIFIEQDRDRKLGFITPIYNEPACSDAACHAHPAAQNVLGVLDVTLDLDDVDRELAALKLHALVVVTAEVLVIALFIIFFTRRFVSRPIQELIRGTKAVSEMRLDKPIRIDSSRELDELATSFNAMRERLKAALDEINQATQQLEGKVEARTEQLKVAQQELIQSDRLASLGQLAASVAHEINNPVATVLNFSVLMQRIMKDGGIPAERLEEFRRCLDYVVKETTRVGRIVTDLLAFSRRARPHLGPTNLNAIVRNTIALTEHKLKLSNVEIHLDLQEPLPQIHCDASQIQQIVMNLILNAAEAIEQSGRVSISTHATGENGSVTLEVADTGPGIPREHLPRIFEPFFTTKPEGKGVGLGLSVAYGIVREHDGEITVDSVVGRGTRFRVSLPISRPATASDSAAAPPSPGNASQCG